MNSNQFARWILAEAKKMQQPYADTRRAEELQRQADAFLRDPDNDCLRARGDWRWDYVNQAESLLRNSIEPF